MTGQKVSRLVDPLRKLLRRGAISHASNMLGKLHAADVARLTDYLDGELCDQVFDLMLRESPKRAADMISELQPTDSVRLLDGISEERVASIVAQLSSDDAAEIIHEMPEEVAATVLGMLKDSDSAPIEGLLGYEEETAGRIMSTEVFALEEHTSVNEAIAALRHSRAETLEMVFYLYVVDDRHHLVGVCSLRELLLAEPGAELRDVMNTRVTSVHTDTDQEEVARLVARYNILAIPVVNHENKLVGIITVDDIIDIIQEEETEDILRMAGVGDDEEEVLRASLWKNARLRLPWLLVAFAGGLVASRSIGQFSGILQRVVALAAFIPIILGMGGNAGTQSATIIVRGLATGRITPGQIWRVVFREIRIALLIGLFFGVTLFGVTMALNAVGWLPGASSGPAVQPTVIGFIVAIAITTTMTLAATVGTCMPILLRRLGADPAIATGPFVTTTIDVLGVLAYFTIATSLLGVAAA